MKFVVEMSERVETYPEDPRPSTVDLMVPVMAIPATLEIIVDASSVGSMKLLMQFSNPFVVDINDKEEMYPEDPNPSTVDRKLAVIAGAKAVEKEEKL